MTNFTYKGARVASIIKFSKWTWGAFDENEVKLCSAPSQPKLEAKFDRVVSEKPAKVKKVKKEKLIKEKKKKAGSIKHLAISLITSGKEDDEIVKEVKSAFPESKFNFSHISWYRSTLFRDGIIGPEYAPRRTHAYKDWKKAQK